jgi:hypothetical protein
MKKGWKVDGVEWVGRVDKPPSIKIVKKLRVVAV